MDPMSLIGWLFLLASWFPKPFMKDEQLRKGINLALASIATGVFISFAILKFIK